MSKSTAHLEQHRFAELFRDELEWDRACGAVTVGVDGRSFHFDVLARKRGFHALHCSTDRAILLNRGLLRQLQDRIARLAHRHVLIYSSERPRRQVWQWAICRPDGSRLRHRQYSFRSASPPKSFVDRLKGLQFLLDGEDEITPIHRYLTRLSMRGNPEADGDAPPRAHDAEPCVPECSERSGRFESLSDPHFLAYHEPHLLASLDDDPARRTELAEQTLRIRAAVTRLRPREALFIPLRFGFDGPARTLADIGREAGLTRERVRQIISRGLERLGQLIRREMPSIDLGTRRDDSAEEEARDGHR